MLIFTLLAVLLAAVAAVLFAASVQLQHAAVATEATAERLRSRSLLRVMRSRVWQGGTALVALATALHVVALSLAPLAVVQPIGVISLVLSVLFGARTGRVGLTVGVRLAVVAVCVGVAGFVALTALTAPARSAGTAGYPGVTQFVVLGALAAAALGLRTTGRARCLVLASCAAVVFGLGSTLIRAASQDLLVHADSLGGIGLALEATGLALFGSWVAHQAYASGPASVVVAATTVLDPFTAVLVGFAVYGEPALTRPAAASAQIGLALLAVAGVLVLARTVGAQKSLLADGPAQQTADGVGAGQAERPPEQDP